MARELAIAFFFSVLTVIVYLATGRNSREIRSQHRVFATGYGGNRFRMQGGSGLIDLFLFLSAPNR